MDVSTQANGKMGNSMAKENLHRQLVLREKVFGKMVKESVGLTLDKITKIIVLNF